MKKDEIYPVNRPIPKYNEISLKVLMVKFQHNEKLRKYFPDFVKNGLPDWKEYLDVISFSSIIIKFNPKKF